MKKILSVLLSLILLCGCAPKPPIVEKAAIYQIKTGLMHTTLITDINDNQWEAKLNGLYKYGHIDFLSSVVQVVRPKFGVVTPYKKVGEKYDLTQWNDEFFAHLDKVLNWCKAHNVILQLDIFNEPTARHTNKLPAYSGDNIQGFVGNFPDDLRKPPSGAWEKIARELIIKMVPYINRGGAVLWLLEGTGSGNFEMWGWNIAKNNGLSPSVYIITNSNLPGAIKSPHMHSIADVKKHAKRTAYLSSDGWDKDSPSLYNQSMSICVSKRCAAFETYAKGFISGYHKLDANGNTIGGIQPYDKRERPTLQQLSKSQFAKFILTMGKY
jgi:hypothetical protein